ncbi:MAG: uroporphyrinogen decarboxylase family protein [Pseudomonadota bacterium]
MDKTPEELYQEREKRVNDTIQLKEPDRIPVMSLFGFFPARYAGITCQEAMNDSEKMKDAWIKTITEFGPDTIENPFFYLFFASILHTLDFKQLKWPGHGVDPMRAYQFIEGEYMKEDEYDPFLFDPTDFMIRRYWPRVFGALKPFERLPPLSQIISYYMGLVHFAAFDSPEVIGALESLLKAAKETRKMLSEGIEFEGKMKELGFPMQFGSSAQAPFDTLADFFRGTKGSLLDLYRHPDKLMEATEKLYPLMLRMGLSAKKREIKRVFIPIHKGLDGFMSKDHFKTFFWPTLRRLIVELIHEGLNPMILWEGNCTSRLEIIGDIPKGKAIYWFERTDIFKAKEVIGDTVCIRGNVPLSILYTGTPDAVKAYCKKLIDIVGKGGGFIMDASTVLDDAKPENVKAMIDFTKDYGRYR